jgi:tetratricopeptide (TPR) repeat protein
MRNEEGNEENRTVPGSTHSELSGTTRDAVQAGRISGGVHFHDHGGGRARSENDVPRQLLADVRGFVNRVHELAELNAVLPGEDGAPLVVSVCLIAGTAGAGKTSLALHWAHHIRERFPDGQLYINLRGYDAGEPVTAHEALRRFLAALGVPASGIPEDTEAASALFRSRLADRRMLIVLDNAASVAQVRPLLPGHGQALVIVTSRGRLSGLAIRDGARRLTLGTLPEHEAVALLRTVTAGYRPADDAEKLAELARLCARLPLALRIAAERAAGHPHMSLDDLIADLRDESALWDALSTDDEEEAEAVRTVFAWSYRALSVEAARLFRLLGLHPAREFGIESVAALAGVSVRRTRQLLDVLVSAHLLEQTAPDRYEFHDLLRAYATNQAQQDEPPHSRAEALRHVLDWYLRSAEAARGWLKPGPAEPAPPALFPDYDAAVNWAEREHDNFLPVVRAAEAAGEDAFAGRLAAVLWGAKAPSATVHAWLTIAEIGLVAVRRLGDRAGEAELLEYQGMGHARINLLTESRRCHERALEIRRESGDRRGEAASLNLLGIVELRRRRLAAAEDFFSRAGAVFGELGERHRAAMSLSNLSSTRFDAGKLEEAEADARQALEIHRELGARRSVGNALNQLSAIHCERGEAAAALATAQEAVELALDLRNDGLEGYWLISLGDAQRESGQLDEALASYHRSASLHRRLGDRSREAMAWAGAGETYLRWGREREAADFFRRAAAVHRELGDTWYEALALDRLAEAVAAEDPDRAAEHRRAALGLLEDYPDPRATAMRRRLATDLEGTSG